MSIRLKTALRYCLLAVMCLKYISILIITIGSIIQVLGYSDLGELVKVIGVFLSFKEFSAELEELKELSDERQ